MAIIYVALYHSALDKLVKGIFQKQRQERKHTVSFFDDGLQVYRQVLKKPPDLLLLDVFLPSLSGPAIARLLKFQEPFQKIPILILSSAADDNLIKESRQAGSDGFFDKKSAAAELLSSVTALLQKRAQAITRTSNS